MRQGQATPPAARRAIQPCRGGRTRGAPPRLRGARPFHPGARIGPRAQSTPCALPTPWVEVDAPLALAGRRPRRASRRSYALSTKLLFGQRKVGSTTRVRVRGHGLLLDYVAFHCPLLSSSCALRMCGVCATSPQAQRRSPAVTRRAPRGYVRHEAEESSMRRRREYQRHRPVCRRSRRGARRRRFSSSTSMGRSTPAPQGAWRLASSCAPLHNERVATFDADTLMDYRSHRPIVTVDNWVSSPDMVMPETVLDLVEDDMGNPILVLHGAEPDAHWESFTERDQRASASAPASRSPSRCTACPRGVPHTRTDARARAGDRRIAASPGVWRDLEPHAVPLAAVHLRADPHGATRHWRAGAARRGPVLHGGHRLPGRLLGAAHLLREVRGPVSARRRPRTGCRAGPGEHRQARRGQSRHLPHGLRPRGALRRVDRRGRARFPLPGTRPAARRRGGEEKSHRRTLATSSRPTSRRSRAPRTRRSSPFSAPRAPKSPTEPAKPDTIEDVLARVEARRNGPGPGPSAPRHRA